MNERATFLHNHNRREKTLVLHKLIAITLQKDYQRWDYSYFINLILCGVYGFEWVCLCVCMMRIRCYSNRNACDFALKYHPKRTTTTIKKVKVKHKTYWYFKPWDMPSPTQFNHIEKKEQEKLVLFCKMYVVRVQCLFKWCRYIKRNHAYTRTAHTHTHANVIYYLVDLHIYRICVKIRKTQHTSSFLLFPLVPFLTLLSI